MSCKVLKKIDKYNIELLEDDSIQFLCKLRIGNKLQNLKVNKNVEEKHEVLGDKFFFFLEQRYRKEHDYYKCLSIKDQQNPKQYVGINREVKKKVANAENEGWE